MRQLWTYSCLVLLVPMVACQVGDEAELEAELAPDAGLDEETALEDADTFGGDGVSLPYLHMFADRTYQGAVESRASYDTDLGNDGFDNKASSLFNDSDHFWLLYTGRAYGGRRICIRPRSRVANLRNVTWVVGSTTYSWNDRISSVRRVGETRATCGDNVPVVGTR